MKRLTTLVVTTLVMAGCSSSADALEVSIKDVKTPNTAGALFTPAKHSLNIENVLNRSIARGKALAVKAKQNTIKVEKVIQELKARVGKTSYVFSGATPSGWDCSGLVYWAYQQLGVELKHSANKQGHSGQVVKIPKIGDVVVFSYKGSHDYYHSSIYIGDGKVIHAGFRKGTKTAIIPLSSRAFKDSDITFVRFIPTA